MVDVSGKDVTVRTATATGGCSSRPRWSPLLRGGGVPKGDALAVARIAGIQAAKRTPDLVPLCHPIAIHGVEVDLQVDGRRACAIAATVRTADRTGVEMEALTCVAVAGLALIDMVKAVDRGGDDHRRPGRAQERRSLGRVAANRWPVRGVCIMRALVVTVSNRAAAGVYEDRTGPVLVEGLVALGFEVDGPEVVPDGEPVEEVAARGGRLGVRRRRSPPAAPASRRPTGPRR